MLPIQQRPIDEVLRELVSLRYDRRREPPDKVLAEMFGGVSASAFSNYRQGKRKPSQQNCEDMGLGWAATLLTDPSPDDPALPLNELSERLRNRRIDVPLKVEELGQHFVAMLSATVPKTFDIQDGEAEQREDFFPSVLRRELPLLVSSLSYGSFCSDPGAKVQNVGFFNEIFARFEAQLGSSIDVVVRPRTGFDLRQEFLTAKSHLALCYFANIERALTVKFFRTPLRVSLGMLCNASHRHLIQQIAEKVSLGRTSTGTTSLKRPLRFLAIENEVGDLYLRQQRFTAPYERKPTLNAAALAERLVQMGKESAEEEFRHEQVARRIRELEKELEAAHTDDELGKLHDELAKHRQEAKLIDTIPIPVLLVDEYTALLVLRHAREELKLELSYALPLTTARQNRESDIRREMPLYYMSFACGREYAKFTYFLQDALDHFLTSEVQTTAVALASLLHNLEAEIFEIAQYVGQWRGGRFEGSDLTQLQRQIIARQYALFALSLDVQTIKNSDSIAKNWKRILQAAQTIIRSDWVQNPKYRPEVKKFIDEFLEEFLTAPADKYLDKLEDLNEYFDPNEPFVLDEIRGLDAPSLLALAERKLLDQKPADKVIVAERVDPARIQEHDWVNLTHPRASAIHALMTQLLKMYRELDPIPLFTEAQWCQELDHANVPKDNGGRDRWKYIKRKSAQLKDTILERITNTLGSRCLRYSGNDGIVILAYEQIRPNQPRYVGMVFVRAKPGLWSQQGDGRFPCDKVMLIEADDPRLRDELEQTCEIRYLFVIQECRHRQIARMLINDAEAWCRGQGFTKVQVAILPQLQEAISLAQNMGYSLKKERSSFDNRDAEARIIFTKDLSPAARSVDSSIRDH
jgi:GNAT superfamily N-acetyltransferase